MSNDDFVKHDPALVRRIAKQLVYRQDVDAYFREQLKIQTKGMELIPFIPNPVQVPLMKIARDRYRKFGKVWMLVFKCRQPGISTWATGMVDHKIFLNEHVYAFVIAQDKATVQRLFTMHEVAWASMDESLRPAQKYHTKGTELVFGEVSNQSRLLVGEAKNMNVGTGQTIHVVHSSECSRYPYPQQISDSLIPALSDSVGTVRIFESTAHTAPGGVWFKSMCDRARRGEGEYGYYFVEWWRMPEYQIPLAKGEKLKLSVEEKMLTKQYKLSDENIKWRRMKINDMDGDVETFRQNYPINFDEGWIIKGMGAFPADRLLEMRENVRPPRRSATVYGGRIMDDPEGDFQIWFEPDPSKTYDIGADVGSGDADVDGDYSVVEVIERYSNKQVAEWRGFIDPVDFAEVIAAIGRFYNNAQVAPEIEKYGMGTLARLQQIYTNIYIWRKRDTMIPEFTHQVGWSTSYQSKLIIVALARHFIWHRKVQVYSQALWNELRTYCKDVTPTGMPTYNAASGEHDDCTMAWMIALQASDDENLMKYAGNGLESKESKKIEMVEAAFRAPPLTALTPMQLKDETGDWS